MGWERLLLNKLAEYRFALARITRMREHVLPAEQVLLLARSGGMAQSAETVFSMLTNADLTFPTIRDEEGNEVELSEERYGKYIYSQNRQVRRDAFLGLFTTYGKVRNTLAATLSGSVRKNLFYTQVRKYPSCLDATLFPNAIPVEVYENAVKTVNAHLEPLHRYMRLKKRALGLEELHMYDLYVPLVEETQKDIPYEEALETVRKALAPLGEEYLAELDTAFAKPLDRCLREPGKTERRYSWGTYGVHPFVLLNYTGTLRDTFTIAHEMGHALHSTFTDRSQPFAYSGHAIFTAEVASTTNEALLLDHLIRTSADPQEKLFLLNYALEQVRTTVYRQLLFAEFELEIHRRAERGEPLTPDVLASVWRELNLRYYGPDVVVDPELDVEWARIPHFYSAFYVYQYATGFAASTALSRQILSEGAPAVTRYLEFLKSGSSDYPIELLRKAGVDMSAPAPSGGDLRALRGTAG
jgi:oligoendopeptidase F